MKLDIVEVAEDAPSYTKMVLARIVPGSILIVSDRGTHIRIYYEGGIYTRVNRPPTKEERIDYAKIAAGRSLQEGSTSAIAILPNRQGLKVIGHVDTNSWQVHFD